MEDQSPPPGDQPEARVLLADDSAVEREALAHLLRQAGYQVDEADDRKPALSWHTFSLSFSAGFLSQLISSVRLFK